jgi:uncharacterized membrane protein
VRTEDSSRQFFAATLAILGIVGLIKGDFTQLWLPGLDRGPLRDALVWLSAVVSLGCGVGLLWPRTARAASRVLVVFSLAWLLLLRVPPMIRAFAVDTWWACAQTAAVAGAAWVLYVRLAGVHQDRPPAFAAGRTGLRLARALYGLALIPFGIAHFVYLAHTASMVPGWLPWHVAWACFFGGAFIAAGVAMMTGVLARLAAALMAVQLALFTVLVWVPVIAGTPSASDWGEFVVSWALTAAAGVVAESYRGTPWLAVRHDRP